MGSPAKFIRPLNEDEIAMIGAAKKSYVENSKIYRYQLSAID